LLNGKFVASPIEARSSRSVITWNNNSAPLGSLDIPDLATTGADDDGRDGLIDECPQRLLDLVVSRYGCAMICVFRAAIAGPPRARTRRVGGAQLLRPTRRRIVDVELGRMRGEIV